MARKSEREFVGGDMSDEEFAALNGDAEADQAEITPETTSEPQLSDPPAQTAEPAAQAATQPQADTEPKMVDVRALQEARAEIRKRDEELARTRAEQIRIEERLNLLNEALARNSKPQEEAPKVPSLEEDPLDYIQHRFKTVEEQLAAIAKAEEDRRKFNEAEAARQRVVSEADMVLAAAGQRHADVVEALNFAANGVKQEIHRLLTQQGVTGQDYMARANQMWNNEITRLAQACPRDPDGAAEFVRRNARYWGWAGPQPAPTQQRQTQPVPQAQQPTIQQRADQQQRHMSLSGVSGAEPPKALDAVALGKMSDKEYRELLKTVAGRKAVEEAFGGF